MRSHLRCHRRLRRQHAQIPFQIRGKRAAFVDHVLGFSEDICGGPRECHTPVRCRHAPSSRIRCLNELDNQTADNPGQFQTGFLGQRQVAEAKSVRIYTCAECSPRFSCSSLLLALLARDPALHFRAVWNAARKNCPLHLIVVSAQAAKTTWHQDKCRLCNPASA